MANGPEAPRITFDTNVVAVPETRAFWATLCEETGQRMMLTPTAAGELLRRIRLEEERRWERRLRMIDKQHGLRLSKKGFRRLSTIAAAAARDQFQDELAQQGSIYACMPRLRDDDLLLGDEVSARIPDLVFDLGSDTGIRDRNIVIEALVGGFDILASNSIGSISHSMLRDWIEGPDGQDLGLTSTILRPEAAEERLRKACGKSLEWTGCALARSCVTDPDDEGRAAREMLDALVPFDRRGMPEIRWDIERMMSDPARRRTMLESVRRHGGSLAMRSEARRRAAASEAVEKETGVALDM